MFSSTSTQTGRISIHALREEGDLDPSQSLRGVRISIHALREEGDLPEKDRQAVRSISIHALREEGDRHPAERRAGLLRISIHALREEGDGKISSIEGEPDNFYPRPPRGGRRSETSADLLIASFLSTPSARRATLLHPAARRLLRISIHALREEGDLIAPTKIDLQAISIHALREEGDVSAWIFQPARRYFYPRPPRGGRHGDISQTSWWGDISIHALREEGDQAGRCDGEREYGISIHALREEGDGRRCHHVRACPISIHALREEGDFLGSLYMMCELDFYPRPPRGGRRQHPPGSVRGFLISIHALREEGDVGRCLVVWTAKISIHALREEGDLDRTGECQRRGIISIHALREEGDIFFGGWGFPLRGFLSTPSARRATNVFADA